MSTHKTLIFVPTYNERENAPELFKQILALGLDADVLFVDDSSPDGTGQFLDELATGNPRLQVIHRPGKLGIGSAHVAGITWAYEHGYTRLVTMDCDFTHSPARYSAVVRTERWLRRGGRLSMAADRQLGGLEPVPPISSPAWAIFSLAAPVANALRCDRCFPRL